MDYREEYSDEKEEAVSEQLEVGVKYRIIPRGIKERIGVLQSDGTVTIYYENGEIFQRGLSTLVFLSLWQSLGRVKEKNLGYTVGIKYKIKLKGGSIEYIVELQPGGTFTMWELDSSFIGEGIPISDIFRDWIQVSGAEPGGGGETG